MFTKSLITQNHARLNDLKRMMMTTITTPAATFPPSQPPSPHASPTTTPFFQINYPLFFGQKEINSIHSWLLHTFRYALSDTIQKKQENNGGFKFIFRN